MEIVEVEIEWTGTKRHAELLISSIYPDDPESFLAEVIERKDGAKLIIKVSSCNLNSIRSTIDDLLVCLSAAVLSLSVIENNNSD
jgi:hypothetical protein